MGSALLYRGRWLALLVRLCGPACSCPSPGKSPHREGRGWQVSAIQRFEECGEAEMASRREVLRKHLDAGGNLGLALPSHTVALDVDTDVDGGADFTKMLARNAIELLCGDHPTQESGSTADGTASGRRIGVHVFGRLEGDRVYGTHYGTVPVTIRHRGNQVVVAPSRHLTGADYRWLRELPGDPSELPAFDSSLFRHVSCGRDVAVLRKQPGEEDGSWRKHVSRAWRDELSDPSVTFSTGRRHEAMLWMGWHLTREGADPAGVVRALLVFARTRCEVGGRFGAPQGSPAARDLEREAASIARTCRAHYEEWHVRRRVESAHDDALVLEALST